MVIIILLILGLFVFIAFYFLLQLLLRPRRRIRNFQFKIREGYILKEKQVSGYQLLFNGCGLRWDVVQYLIIKRNVMILCVLCLLSWASIYFVWNDVIHLNSVFWTIVLIVGIGGIFYFDKSIFDFIRRRRKEKIILEVYALSKQLLYYCGSRMNLHSKLLRCLPYTKTIRGELDLLTREWYESAEKAMKQFKNRLGTEEGISFAETLDSLRLNESEHFYDLLRQRIQDYKDKIDLTKESKKESHSYLLFILAGIPILNTFRVFVYPWVQEGQRLFESLN